MDGVAQEAGRAAGPGRLQLRGSGGGRAGLGARPPATGDALGRNGGTGPSLPS